MICTTVFTFLLNIFDHFFGYRLFQILAIAPVFALKHDKAFIWFNRLIEKVFDQTTIYISSQRLRLIKLIVHVSK